MIIFCKNLLLLLFMNFLFCAAATAAAAYIAALKQFQLIIMPLSIHLV